MRSMRSVLGVQDRIPAGVGSSGSFRSPASWGDIFLSLEIEEAFVALTELEREHACLRALRTICASKSRVAWNEREKSATLGVTETVIPSRTGPIISFMARAIWSLATLPNCGVSAVP
jgi:hypothetical protein